MGATEGMYYKGMQWMPNCPRYLTHTSRWDPYSRFEKKAGFQVSNWIILFTQDSKMTWRQH